MDGKRYGKVEVGCICVIADEKCAVEVDLASQSRRVSCVNRDAFPLFSREYERNRGENSLSSPRDFDPNLKSGNEGME